MQVNVKVLGIKDPITVKSTTENVKKTFEFQKKVTKNGSNMQGDNEMAQLNQYYTAQIKNIGLIMDYVADMLKLNATYKQKLNKIKFAELQSLSDTIIQGVLHYDKANDSQGKK